PRAELGAGGGGQGVQLAGTVDEADKRALVAGADVLVAPHRGGESFGIVLVEAMATGTPVVASDLPAFRDVMAGTGTLVRPGDPAALARAVVEVLLAPADAAGAERAAVRRRAAGYDWPVVGAAWAEVYELAREVAGGPGAARARLRRELLDRAVAAAEHAAAGLLADHPGAPGLARAAHDAGDPDDLAAQSRLTALVRSGVLAPPVATDLSRSTDRVAAVRTLANDVARRRGEPTTELDDDAGGPGTSRGSWPWCPSLDGC
ncbi:glycosyltransferase family 4 protein, partial [Aquipuribacter sp. MA13-13]